MSRFKIPLLLCVGFGLVFSCGKPQNSGTSSEGEYEGDSELSITIKGSDTVLPLAEEHGKNFMSLFPEASVKVVGGGSGVGIAALINNTTDIAMVSRNLNYQEKNSLALLGKTTERVVVAYDALAVVLHPKNPVKDLTLKDIERIYTGKITNWQELGGPDLQIVACSRELSSGTYEYFKEIALHNRAYADHVLKMPATSAIVETVASTPGGIGYVGVGYLTDAVVPARIWNRNIEEYVEPTLQHAQNNMYPIVRPLYLFFLQEDTGRLKAYIDFVLSEDGQALVTQVGYVPL